LFAIFMIIAFIPLAFMYVYTGNPALSLGLAILALFFDIIAFSTKLYAVFFIPFLKMKKGVVVMETEEPFVMSPSGNAIIVRKDRDVYASAFVKIPTYRSGTEMQPDEKIDFARLFSRALTISRKPVKFGAQLYVINKDAYINNIRNKLNEAEERYQEAIVKKDISKADAERIRGEVTMWHNLFDNVSKVKSQALEAYAMTTALGGNEEEAVNLALQQADELCAGISSVFGVTATIAEGEDMLKFVEPDYMIPLVTISEQIRERTVTGEM
jgi:hypothetical protein